MSDPRKLVPAKLIIAVEFVGVEQYFRKLIPLVVRPPRAQGHCGSSHEQLELLGCLGADARDALLGEKESHVRFKPLANLGRKARVQGVVFPEKASPALRERLRCNFAASGPLSTSIASEEKGDAGSQHPSQKSATNTADASTKTKPGRERDGSQRRFEPLTRRIDSHRKVPPRRGLYHAEGIRDC